MTQGKKIFDCGCVVSRPKDASVNTYGTRWRAYISEHHVILKCRDCGKWHYFKLKEPRIDQIRYGEKEDEMVGNDKE